MTRQEFCERLRGGMATVFEAWRAAAEEILADPSHPHFVEVARIITEMERRR